MNDDDTISQALDIANDDYTIESELVQKDDNDFEFARKNLRTILEKGTVALDRMLEVADMSQNPRSYEVVSTLINSLSSSNKDLLELSEKKKRIEKDDSKKTGPVNNNLFIGSTAELQKLIKGE